MHTFIADVHLGKLAKVLRMLGFDTAYTNHYSYTELLQIATTQSRILLSRNKAFEKEAVSFLHITPENTEAQLKQVIDHYDLLPHIEPFTRCLVCNGALLPVPKENVLHHLQKNTATYYNDFWQCSQCGGIYWKGSHYQRMLQLVETLANK